MTTKACDADYLRRNARLRAIGFATYADYLASRLWKSIRRRVYAAKGKSCFLCGARATELHHNRYRSKDLSGRTIKNIYPVCHACHHRVEFQNDRKVSVGQAAATFRRLRKQMVGTENMRIAAPQMGDQVPGDLQLDQAIFDWRLEAAGYPPDGA
jgi:uncharacterized protein YlaI